MDRQASLCWGQRYVWLNHHQLPREARHDLNIFVLSTEPAEGSTVETLRRALDFLVRRHEGLRTTIHLDGDTGPIQRVHPPGRVPVVCHDADDYSPAALGRLLTDFMTAEFALDREWPIRACIVCAGSSPTRMILVGHHTAMDAWGAETLKREADELHSGILAGRAATLPPVRHHPVDLARYEASRDADETHRRSLAHWDGILSGIPADLFGVRRTPDGGEPCGLSASLSSPAALSAGRRLAERFGVWPSIVYAAAFTTLLAAYTRRSVVCYRTYLGNRDGERHADVLTCLFQPGLMRVDCTGDPSFAEVVRATTVGYSATLDNAHSRYDEILESITRHSVERGAGIRIGAAFNHLRYPAKTRGGKRTILNWNPTPWPWSLLDDDFYLRVSEWQDCVVLTLNARPSVATGQDVERFLRGFETLLTSVADSTEAMRVSDVAEAIGFDASPTDADIVVDNTPVDLGRVADILQRLPDVRAAKVFDETTDAGARRLTAYVDSSDPELTPGRLRTDFLARMYDVDQVLCPHWFVVRTAAAVVVAGDGSEPPGVPPETECEHALFETVRSVNRLDGFSMARSYVCVGGRIMKIPLVQQLMRDRGWVGASLYDIASARPLRAVAAMFVPAPTVTTTTRH